MNTAPPPPPSKEQLVETKVSTWLQIKQWMEQTRESERNLRAEIADLVFSSRRVNGFLPKGTTKEAITSPNADMMIKANQKYDYVIDEAVMHDVLAEAALTREQGEGLIRIKYELSLKVYNALPEDKKRIIDKMIEVKPASLELEASLVPKASEGT